MSDQNHIGAPVAVVTGGSRGLGRGIAAALVEEGFRVFATGRTISTAKLPDRVVRITCDHTCDKDTERAFARVAEEANRIDLLVNSAWGGYERMSEDGRFTWSAPFWEQPAHRWASMMDVGVRAAWICASHAANDDHARKRVDCQHWLLGGAEISWECALRRSKGGDG